MRWLLSLLLFVCAVGSGYGAEPGFKEYNPDVQKYEFSKNFIKALSYYARVAGRLQTEDKASISSKTDTRAIKELVDHRTLDNTELRIAKNYLMRYASSPNGLIRRVTVDAVESYDQLLYVSVRERDLWVSFLRYKTSGEPADFNEPAFNEQQVFLAQEKKEIAKALLRASVLATKVMLSASQCEREDCKSLALTSVEREKLSAILDVFSGGKMDWGMKSGQSTLDACVAVLREVLEDSVYLSRI